MGIQCGDVMAILAPNHIDVVIPFYAALYIGVTIAGVDMSLGISK